MSDCILIRMDARVSRRELGLLLAGAAALGAQNPGSPNPEGGGANGADAVAQYRHDAAEELAHFKLPFFTEPAFEFRP